MHQTHAKQPKNVKRGKLPKMGVCVPISVQVTQAALASAHRNDKRNTRNKAKAWQKEVGV